MKQGLWAAAPIPAVNGDEYVRSGALYFYLTRRLCGRHISVGEFYAAGGAEKSAFAGEIIGWLHLALRQINADVKNADLYSDIKKSALPKAKACLGISDEFCRDFQVKLGKLYDTLPRQIIHRDPNPGNIIMTGDKWGFIDFELSENNVRIFDPCYAAAAILSESFDRCDREKWLAVYKNIFTGYDAVVKMTDAERAAVPYILLANQLVAAAYFSQHKKYARIFEVNKRITLWLVGIFDEMQLE